MTTRHLVSIALLILFYVAGSMPVAAQSNTWSVPINLSNSTTNDDYPGIAADNVGNVHVVWKTGASNLFYTGRNGTSWSNPVLLGQSDIGRRAIATDSLGNVHLLCCSGPNSPPLLYYRMFNGTSWTDPVPVSEEITSGVQWPAITGQSHLNSLAYVV